MEPTLLQELQEALSKAPPEVRDLVLGDEVNKSAATLGKLYSLPVALYLPLKNTITYTLLGIIQPNHTTSVLKNELNLTDEQAQSLAKDLDASIFQKARIKILGDIQGEVKTITLNETPSPDELRKEILDTTKRTSAIETSPITPTTPRVVKVITQGSRSQLMEQLNVLGQIPDDEEIAARLAHIQEQIQQATPKEETSQAVAPSVEQNLKERGEQVVAPEPHAASYSKAPTKYNVDPYREQVI